MPHVQAGRNASIAKRCAVGEQKEELLSALRSTAVRAGAGTPRDGDANGRGGGNGARRSLSLRRNLSHHLDQVRLPTCSEDCSAALGSGGPVLAIMSLVFASY